MAACFVCHSDIKGRNLTYRKMNLSSENWEQEDRKHPTFTLSFTSVLAVYRTQPCLHINHKIT